MAYSDTMIDICLINTSNWKEDDKIRIRKNLEFGDYEVVYIDQNNGEPITFKSSSMYRARVLEYIYMLLKNQSLDEQGYLNIQVNLPSMPRVIVSGDKFKDVYYRDHFQELIGTGLDLLDTSEKVCSCSKPRARSSKRMDFD